MRIHSYLLRARPALKAALLICGVLFVLDILFVKSHGTAYLTRGEFLVSLLPPFGTVLCFMPLVYLSWFGPDAPSFLKIPKLIFFWGMTAVWLYSFGLLFLLAI